MPRAIHPSIVRRSSSAPCRSSLTSPGIATTRAPAGVTRATGLRTNDGLLDHRGGARAPVRRSAGCPQAGRPAGRPGGARSAWDCDGPARGSAKGQRAPPAGRTPVRATGEHRPSTLPHRRGGDRPRIARPRLARAGAGGGAADLRGAWRPRERRPRPSAPDPQAAPSRPGRRGGRSARHARGGPTAASRRRRGARRLRGRPPSRTGRAGPDGAAGGAGGGGPVGDRLARGRGRAGRANTRAARGAPDSGRGRRGR